MIPLVTVSLVASPVYAKKFGESSLPPGLQKKVARGKPLPPGWQKKLAVGETLDEDVYEQSSVVIPVDDNGLVTVRVEGTIIRLFEATREIVRILEE
jgi:hypothetical protein